MKLKDFWQSQALTRSIVSVAVAVFAYTLITAFLPSLPFRMKYDESLSAHQQSRACEKCARQIVGKDCPHCDR